MTAAEPLDAAAVPPGAPDRAEGAIPSGEVTQATWAASDAADAQAVAEVRGVAGCFRRRSNPLPPKHVDARVNGPERDCVGRECLGGR